MQHATCNMQLFMPESPYPMLPFEDAIVRVLAEVAPLPSETRRFDAALGMVLAQDVVAHDPLPPFPASTMDGFAVIADDGAATRRLVGDQFAGDDANLTVGKGETARITTGAPLPRGADAVIMVEWSREEEGMVAFTHAVKTGDYVRQLGSDIATGQVVLSKGMRIGAAEIGLLATTGLVEVEVTRRPIVGVMSTGDELVEPHETPGAGQIRDSNRAALMAAVREAGAEAIDLGIAPDEVSALHDFVMAGLARCDALITSGGVSMGERDLVKPLLAEHGNVHFGRVNFKPGKPTTFGILHHKPFFALPGNPVSSLVSFEVFVRPALCKMAGAPAHQQQRPRITAVLEHTLRHGSDRTECQRAIVRWDRDKGQFTATTTGIQESSRLLSMVGANALLILPHGQGDFPAGSIVEAIWVG
jgi:molybdopterin molybdotransferase